MQLANTTFSAFLGDIYIGDKKIQNRLAKIPKIFSNIRLAPLR